MPATPSAVVRTLMLTSPALSCWRSLASPVCVTKPSTTSTDPRMPTSEPLTSRAMDGIAVIIAGDARSRRLGLPGEVLHLRGGDGEAACR